MIDQGKRNVLGVMVDALDYEAAVGRIVSAAEARRSYSCTALAVHGVMTGVLDAEHRYRLNRLDLVTPDGQPVRWALNVLHGAALDDRVYGPTLMLEVCGAASAAGLPIYLFGAQPSTVGRLRDELSARFEGLEIAGAEPSSFSKLTHAERRAMVKRVRDSGAAITFVGLGCPRQEVFAFECAEALSMPVLAVGAAFDYHSGALSQPPALLQRLGLQWAYRLAQDPRRLWRRYLGLNTLYLAMLGLQRLGGWHPRDGRPPREELLHG